MTTDMDDRADKTRQLFFTSFEVAMRIAMPFLIGVAGWTFTNILDHEKRIIRIESTQPTRSDIAQIHDKLNALRETSAVRDAQMESMGNTLDKIRQYIVSTDGVKALNHD